MGFPGNYSDIVVPGFLLRLLLLLGYIRGVLCWFLKFFGLSELVDTEDVSWLQNNEQAINNYQYSTEMLSSRLSSAKRIQDSLPVVKYEELNDGLGDSCAVCLCVFEAEDEVRRLSNCRHVFHRGCLDRWTEHEQCTCPLCRTPLVDGLSTAQECSEELIWLSPDGDFDYSYNEENLYTFFTLTASSALVLPRTRSSARLLSSQFL